MTFYICPSCHQFWAPAGRAFADAPPADRVNGGPRTCQNCRLPQLAESPRCRTCAHAYVRRDGNECTACYRERTGDWKGVPR